MRASYEIEWGKRGPRGREGACWAVGPPASGCWKSSLDYGRGGFRTTVASAVPPSLCTVCVSVPAVRLQATLSLYILGIPMVETCTMGGCWLWEGGAFGLGGRGHCLVLVSPKEQRAETRSPTPPRPSPVPLWPPSLALMRVCLCAFALCAAARPIRRQQHGAGGGPRIPSPICLAAMQARCPPLPWRHTGHHGASLLIHSPTHSLRCSLGGGSCGE